MPQRPKILLIDDDPLLRRAIGRLLIGEGYEVITAEDGARGMELFRREQPVLVITDIFMPRQAGIETILVLRREASPTKIIAISGGGPAGDTEPLETARLLGADRIIEKPFRSDTLLEAVRALAPLPDAST